MLLKSCEKDIKRISSGSTHYNIVWMIIEGIALKADTPEGFCSRSMFQGHAPGAKPLRVYQRFHGYTSSLGAEFPPRKMLHYI